MALRYDAMLPKKLQELESQLNEIFHRRPTGEEEAAEAAAAAALLLDVDDVNRRFDFLKNLLSAEMESHPENKPEHLYHIADRLAFLEDAYLKWAESQTSPTDPLETMSVCSCTYSCYNQDDDDEEEGDGMLDTRNSDPPPVDAIDPETVVFSRGAEEAARRATTGRHWSSGRKKSGVVGAVVVLLVAVIGLAISYLYQGEEQNLLVPT